MHKAKKKKDLHHFTPLAIVCAAPLYSSQQEIILPISTFCLLGP